MIEVPKLVAILLIAVVVWYAMRWWNRVVTPKVAHGRQDFAPRASRQPRREQPTVEDLTACRVCGAYVAAGALACGKPGCPLLR
jgi:uncharacterized protein HemY